MPTEKLYVSSPPHLRGKNSTARIMGDVLIALMPAVVAGTVLFGWRVLLIVAFCNVSCVLLEYVCRKAMRRENTIGDLSAAVTGTLLALSLPVTINLALAFFGCFVAIVVAKQFFGGLGQNFINPAITGRVAMVVSFPSQMTDWSLLNGALDAVSTATPRAPGGQWTYLDLFFGKVNGSIGETCKIAILIGFVYLTVRRVINPVIPVLYIGTVAALSPLFGQDPLFQILSGGLLFVAVFMATDYATSPISMKGKAVYAAGMGVLTILIRVYSSLPECVSYAVMLMNILTPHIDKLTVPKPFGGNSFMKTKIKSVLKPALVLFAICLVTSALLALTNLFAAKKISERSKQSIAETRKKVLSSAVSFEEVNDTCARGIDAGQKTVGYVFTVAEKGYGGDMQVMVGISEGRVTGVSVLSHSETAGLGAKAAEKEFLDQYVGLAESAEIGKNIDKITGATVSSKAVTRAVNKAMDEYGKMAAGQHG